MATIRGIRMEIGRELFFSRFYYIEPVRGRIQAYGGCRECNNYLFFKPVIKGMLLAVIIPSQMRKSYTRGLVSWIIKILMSYECVNIFVMSYITRTAGFNHLSDRKNNIFYAL